MRENVKACFHKQGKCRADFTTNMYSITMCENAKACFREPYKCRVVFSLELCTNLVGLYPVKVLGILLLV